MASVTSPLMPLTNSELIASVSVRNEPEPLGSITNVPDTCAGRKLASSAEASNAERWLAMEVVWVVWGSRMSGSAVACARSLVGIAHAVEFGGVADGAPARVF